MPVSLVGLVYYQDDPDKKTFRIVTPSFDDSELDVPDPIVGEWTQFGIDPSRVAVMDKVALDDPRVAAGLTGTV
jgi:hypothetical protein